MLSDIFCGLLLVIYSFAIVSNFSLVIVSPSSNLSDKSNGSVIAVAVFGAFEISIIGLSSVITLLSESTA